MLTIELNPSEQRSYDRLRARVIQAPTGAPTELRGLLLLLPDFLVLLMRLARDARVPIGAKVVAGLGVAYVVSPIDLMPSLLLGPIGLVDDLLIAGTALSRILNHVHPDLVRSHWSGQGDALEAIQRVTGWTEKQVVGRVRKLVGRFERGIR